MGWFQLDPKVAADQPAGGEFSRHGLRFSSRLSGPVRPPRYVAVGWFQLDAAIPENQSWFTIRLRHGVRFQTHAGSLVWRTRRHLQSIPERYLGVGRL